MYLRNSVEVSDVEPNVTMSPAACHVVPEVSVISERDASQSNALLLGKRYSLPHARIMMHQPSGGLQGQASDIAIQAKEILRIKDRLNQILSLHTKQPLEKIVTDADRDFIMEADQAKAYGVVDHVIARRER